MFLTQKTECHYILFLPFLIYVVAINAWVADDAYITFRVLDNFINGYGLRWNVTERVQAFTNPLWLLLHIPFYYVTHEIFFTTILISLSLITVTFIVAARLFKLSAGFVFAFLLVPLVFSRIFVEYAASGLEIPLNFFLLTLFCYVSVRRNNYAVQFKWLFILGLIAGLSGLNRLDTVLFYFPVLLFLSIRYFCLRTMLAFLLGLFPLLLWLLFSLFYYGFLFPNTAYAKLATGIATRDYLQQGIIYAIDFLKYDPVSSIFVIIAAILTIRLAYSILTDMKRIRFVEMESYVFLLLMGIGLLLYSLYILKVGGDFMSGRFWTLPFFLSVLLIIWYLQQYDAQLKWFSYFIGIALILMLTAQHPFQNAPDRSPAPSTGIIDERRFYLQTNSVVRYTRYNNPSTFHLSKKGIELRERARHIKKRIVILKSGIGMLGFYAGSDVIIIDQYGLAEPLLARMPISLMPYGQKETAEFRWRIGHFFRNVPAGYTEAHETGSLDDMSPELAAYYRPLRYIISGPLFDWGRIKTIFKFNAGAYRHHLKNHIDKHYSLYRESNETKWKR
ncbi:MAG: hypothetical protein GY862_29515 [Gammaproteobacteria bacterium]|nr:hypothetical protein [Gammaproteobacteria bacterium]